MDLYRRTEHHQLMPRKDCLHSEPLGRTMPWGTCICAAAVEVRSCWLGRIHQASNPQARKTTKRQRTGLESKLTNLYQPITTGSKTTGRLYYLLNNTRKIPVPRRINMTLHFATLMKTIGQKRQSYFYSVALELFLCYSYLSDSTLRTSIFT